MKCQNCGNEVSPGEAFCGHCGTPMAPPTHATEMIQAPPPPPRVGLLGSYNATHSLPSQQPGTMGSSPLGQNTGRTRAFQDRTFATNQQGSQPVPAPTPSNPQSEFYQDATEAISRIPGSYGNGPTTYPPQGFINTPPPMQTGQSGMGSMQNDYAGSGQFQPGAFGVQGQQFQPGTHPNSNNTSYSNLNYPQAPYGSGQQFGTPNPNRPPHKQSDNNLLLIALAALVVVVIIFVLLLVFHNNSSTATTPPATATTAPAPSPTTAPTSTPTPADTPTPTPTLAPTAPPTPAPDPGFAWCNTSCISQGFQLEYPATWASTPAGTSVQFINPQLSEITATFKKPGTAYADSTQAINGEMSSTYANQPGFTPPAGAGQGNTTIGGENWSYTTIHYTLNGQPVRVEIIATIHQGSAYIIDLQAYEGEFDQVNQQYFVPMTGHFQFQ